jgi:hypothetical protein
MQQLRPVSCSAAASSRAKVVCRYPADRTAARAGLFLGDYATRMKFVGDIYIGLLQMMVLPYIITLNGERGCRLRSTAPSYCVRRI